MAVGGSGLEGVRADGPAQTGTQPHTPGVVAGFTEGSSFRRGGPIKDFSNTKSVICFNRNNSGDAELDEDVTHFGLTGGTDPSVPPNQIGNTFDGGIILSDGPHAEAQLSSWPPERAGGC
jgi:hypothetical protein